MPTKLGLFRVAALGNAVLTAQITQKLSFSRSSVSVAEIRALVTDSSNLKCFGWDAIDLV